MQIACRAHPRRIATSTLVFIEPGIPHRPTSRNQSTLPSLEDSTGIQIALQQILERSGYFPHRPAPRRPLSFADFESQADLAAKSLIRSPERIRTRPLLRQRWRFPRTRENHLRASRRLPRVQLRDDCEYFEDYEDEVEGLEQYAEGRAAWKECRRRVRMTNVARPVPEGLNRHRRCGTCRRSRRAV